jgi:hypothetical protein
MIRRYITNLSTNIFKRACAAAAVLALTGGCSPPEPPTTGATSSPIAPAAQTQLSQTVEAKTPTNPKNPLAFLLAPKTTPLRSQLTLLPKPLI